MLYYSFQGNYPHQDVDSIFILTETELLCSYRFPCSSIEIPRLLKEIEFRGYQNMIGHFVYDVIQRQEALKSYESSKRLMSTMLKTSQDEQLQLAYRAARRNYVEAVRALDNYSPTFYDLTILRDKKEEADAIFKVIRRVYEQKHMLDECLPKCFDGLPEETINSMYNQECKGE